MILYLTQEAQSEEKSLGKAMVDCEDYKNTKRVQHLALFTIKYPNKRKQ